MELAVHFFSLCVRTKIACQEDQCICFFLLAGQTELRFGAEHIKMSSQAPLMVSGFVPSRSLVDCTVWAILNLAGWLQIHVSWVWGLKCSACVFACALIFKMSCSENRSLRSWEVWILFWPLPWARTPSPFCSLPVSPPYMILHFWRERGKEKEGICDPC